ncbi:MAG: glycosyltransferase [Ornithinibacter sp.]
MSTVTRVVVAVPVRDEAELLAACLRSILRSVGTLREWRPSISTEVVVALDRCTDTSALVVERFPVTAVEVDAGSVGRARHAAVTTALGDTSRRGAEPADTWVVGTDADCVVHTHWLRRHVQAAEAGADPVLGTVEPFGVADASVLAAWRDRHTLREDHEHVHGANLGVRASAYLEAGGFAPLALHEDVDLAARVRGAGRPWIASDRLRVRTSGRTKSRVKGGFATYLTALAPSDRAPHPQAEAAP